MATAALMSPSTPYGHGHGHAHSHSHIHSQPPNLGGPSYHQTMSSSASVSGMISPVEPRRPSADSESSHRQSLPSISEFIGANPTPYPPPPPPPPPHGLAHGPSSLPSSSFPSPFTPRTFDSTTDKNPSPRILHINSTYPPRQEPLPAFTDAVRPAPLAATRGGIPPPLTGFGPQPSPPIKHDHPQPEPDKPSDHHLNGSYPPHAHAPPPPPPPPPHPHYQHSGPHGAHPIHGYPVSPSQVGPPLHSPFEQRPIPRPEEQDFAGRRGYDTTVHRHFEAWGYQDCLNKIATTARTVFNFSEAYARIAQEQNTQRPIPERLPSEREVTDMLNNVDLLKRSLEGVRDLVQQSIANEHSRGSKSGKHPYEEEDISMYSGESTKPTYVSEAKKRRGRAAPPGRCHSCNRIDTPEWRRGPDGARTLCNACGLHYAKLERKRQLEARSIRPKPADERS